MGRKSSKTLASGAKIAALLAFFVVNSFFLLRVSPPASAAPNMQISPTPIQISIPTMTPPPAQEVLPTETRTPTPVGPALAEALSNGTNVRAGPDINAERLGTIDPGEFYAVLGLGAGTRWYRIQFPESPNGTGWVYEEVVRITGDTSSIPEIDLSGEPTIDAGPVILTQTIEAMIQTPGAAQTATAQAAISGVSGGTNAALPVGTPTILPTFTYPPDSMLQPTSAAPVNTAEAQEGIPPIIPILALGAFGGLGLLVGVLRRVR